MHSGAFTSQTTGSQQTTALASSLIEASFGPCWCSALYRNQLNQLKPDSRLREWRELLK
jgi:hypothetical protein